MSHSVSVTVEWRRGVTGEDGTFTFSPKPFMTRQSPGRRIAELTVPLRAGTVVQNQGADKRTIQLRGTLFLKSYNWDEMETLRNNLRDGLQIGPGQLHIISPQRHLRYDGQITTAGVRFAEQARSNLQDYIITIIITNGLEINVTDSIQSISSDADVT